MEETSKKVETMVAVLQYLLKEFQVENSEQPPPLEDTNDGGIGEIENTKEGELNNSTPQADPHIDHIEKRLKESSMFNIYFNDCVGFTSIPKWKLPLKFTMLDIKFNRTKILITCMRNFVSAMTLKRIDKDIFHFILPFTFENDVMRLYNTMGPRKVTN